VRAIALSTKGVSDVRFRIWARQNPRHTWEYDSEHDSYQGAHGRADQIRAGGREAKVDYIGSRNSLEKHPRADGHYKHVRRRGKPKGDV
jgi:hypothetical protein